MMLVRLSPRMRLHKKVMSKHIKRAAEAICNNKMSLAVNEVILAFREQVWLQAYVSWRRGCR